MGLPLRQNSAVVVSVEKQFPDLARIGERGVMFDVGRFQQPA
jgi:hypothetical protein